jgi:ceramide glucosyltransferase
MAGHAIQKLDLNVEIMRQPIKQYIGEYTFQQFWLRHLRWGRIRKSIAPFAFLIEPLFFSVVAGIAGATAIHQLFEINGLVVFVTHMMSWGLWDLYLTTQLDRFSLKALGAWFIRETLALPLWLNILFGNSVHWRGKEYRLLQGGLLEGVE